MTKFSLEMKLWEDLDIWERAVLIVGTAEEIKPVYKSMHRNMKREESNFTQEFCGSPHFRPHKCYGLMFTGNGCGKLVTVLTADTVIRYLTDNDTIIRKLDLPGLNFLKEV